MLSHPVAPRLSRLPPRACILQLGRPPSSGGLRLNTTTIPWSGISRLLTAHEVAERFNCSPKTTYKFASSGALPSILPGGSRALRFDLQDVERFLEAGRGNGEGENEEGAKQSRAQS